MAQSFKKLGEIQESDPKLKEIIAECSNNVDNPSFQLYNGIFFHREKNSNEWRIVIPEKLQRSLIEAIHEK